MLADFGLSKVIEDLNEVNMSSTSTACAGTLRWKAPELVETDSNNGVTLASDIWALGCTIYEVLYLPTYSLGFMNTLASF